MFRSIAIVLALCFATASAQAALQGRLPVTPNGTDYQAVYDSDRDITWLANANLAVSNAFGVPSFTTLAGIDSVGRMNWGTAQSWIAAMNLATYLGVSDWRLPTTAQPDATCSSPSGGPDYRYGFNCTDSEMGHLFYRELGGVAGQDIAMTHNSNYMLFSNVEAGGEYYWSGSSPFPDYAWQFFFNGGFEYISFESHNFYHAWPVAPGDPLAVPILPAAFLFPSALAALAWGRRGRKLGGES